mgnify:CR=1 FL=1
MPDDFGVLSGGESGAGVATGAPAAFSGGDLGAPQTSPTSLDSGATSGGSGFNFTEFVPQEYREKAWVKDLERSGEAARENLFKMVENQQTLLGKQPKGLEIPTAESSDEVKQNFRKALGVPEKPEGYEYSPPDLSKEPEDIQNLVKTLSEDTTMQSRMKAKAHEIGLRPADFQALASEFDQIRIEELKGARELAQKNQQTFIETQHKQFTEIYGDKADLVKQTAHEMAKKIIPENVRATGDDSLALYEVLRFVHEKFYKDDVIISPNVASGGQVDRAGMHKMIMAERAKPEYIDPFHPQHAALHKKVDEMYQRMVQMQ